MMNAVIKHLDASYPPIQQAAGRYISGLMIVLPVALYNHGLRALLWPARPLLMHLRGVLNLGGERNPTAAARHHTH